MDAAFNAHLLVVNSDLTSPEEKQQSELEIAKIAGHLMSPLLPTGIVRNVLMVVCIIVGVTGLLSSYWWLCLFLPVPLAFSPRITGELSYLVGRFQAGRASATKH